MTAPEFFDRTLHAEAARSEYKIGDKSLLYTRSGYDLAYSSGLAQVIHLAKSSANRRYSYYDIVDAIEHTNWRMSDASQELALQLDAEKRCPDIRYSCFADLLNPEYSWQLTDTGLVAPRGHWHDRCVKGPKGVKLYPRIVFIGNEEVGEILVPESGTVMEWDGVFGLPKVTSTKESGLKPCGLPTSFNFKPGRSQGKHPVSIMRMVIKDDRGYKIKVSADYPRNLTLDRKTGFRPVKPEITPDIERVD